MGGRLMRGLAKNGSDRNVTEAAAVAGRSYNSDWRPIARHQPIASGQHSSELACYFITKMKYLIFRDIITSIRFFQGDDKHA
jgi:hypothetical protein